MKPIYTALIATLCLTSLASPALADRDGWRGHKHHHRHHGWHNVHHRPVLGWVAPRRVVQYTVVQPVYYTPTYAAPRVSDRYCREYQHTAFIGGRLQETYGTACLAPDGSWELLR
jgi:hypothetical protein